MVLGLILQWCIERRRIGIASQTARNCLELMNCHLNMQKKENPFQTEIINHQAIAFVGRYARKYYGGKECFATKLRQKKDAGLDISESGAMANYTHLKLQWILLP